MVKNNRKVCDFCGIPINIHTKIKHINIENDPNIHYFCNIDCKTNYIHQIQKENNLLLE